MLILPIARVVPIDQISTAIPIDPIEIVVQIDIVVQIEIVLLIAITVVQIEIAIQTDLETLELEKADLNQEIIIKIVREMVMTDIEEMNTSNQRLHHQMLCYHHIKLTIYKLR